ncbi:hypothetical protein [Pelagovum pacificum]|uniref:SURF1-like protein n=1 Tax=Pelagovum pacificum TaxID=2588711 RepID=A0A5C5GCQ0_9RHOB|nr:hypothetical protein [Pelagovum pacificum]QQA42285.1 hypothetical protein I8N54_16040 [Pelagovum pacificum]TNY31369.1 hypothetical protein FHY64_15230 [Pelagovum pacificum]
MTVVNPFLLVLRLPWWSYFLLAALLVGGAQLTRVLPGSVDEVLETPVPAAVAISSLAPAGDQPAETVLTAQLDLGLSGNLVDERGDRAALWVLIDEDATRTPPAVSGLLTVPWSERDKAAAWLMDRVVSYGAVGPVIELHGMIDGALPQGGPEAVYLVGKGHGLAPDGFRFAPFLDGREAGLRAMAAANVGWMPYMFGVAALLCILGGGKLAFRQVARNRLDVSLVKRRTQVAEPIQATSPAGDSVLPGSPIDRIRARKQIVSAPPPQV